MTIRTVLNELFVRLSDDGTSIKGVHAADRTAMLDDAGNETRSWMEPPRAVDPSDAQVLGVIGQALNLAALNSVDALTVQVATLTSERDAAVNANALLQAARDAALAQLAALQPVVNGVPQFIKKWQLWAGLRMDDPTLTTYNAVKAYTDSFTGMKRDLWLDSTGIERKAPALAEFKAAFHKTDADLDGMFTRYAAITIEQASALR